MPACLAAVTVWDIAKWPVLLLIIGLILAILFWASPNVRHGFQWVSPGGFIAVVLWLVASALFAVYVANFSHYNKVYGSLAGVIIFLIWMWISNVAILLGAEFNAELERGPAMAAGRAAMTAAMASLRLLTSRPDIPDYRAAEPNSASAKPLRFQLR